MQTRSIRGFLFDLHGVIADSWQYHLESWQAIATELRVPWTAELTRVLPGMSRRESLMTILSSVNRQAEFDEDQLLAITDHENELYRQFIAQMTPANRLPGITAFLDELQAANYPLALASASTNAPAEIKRLGLTHVFTKIVAAEKLRASKPAPDVYLAAAKLINQAPQRCVALEDTVTGVQAAKAAGCLTIGINTEALPGADARLATTAELSLAAVQRVLGLPIA
ncbi:beta-phosphoglucomutase family hydrolase [Levilactobacillus koreensis]|uniref:HAD family hydrolase n=1 Tax=Levilactobacillus koreensis TaxID=637971 RepID=A0AAC8UW55_9LACO|nr:beta-phosphoglucomutase family hydrolase [Levilactobacillus koreensis]AKP65042.1 HAD family hydrolase [Levilactobacillus koreensis]